MSTFFRREFALPLGLVVLLVAYGPAQSLFFVDFGFLNYLFLFFVVFGTMVFLAFGVVRHADHLAAILGEPLGTLILTLAVISIEVAMISAIMLSGAADPTLARDTMMAVLMIVLNGVVGLVLIAGGIRHSEQEFNLRGARAYLTVLATLVTVTMILPKFTRSTTDPTLNPFQSIVFASITILLYAAFLSIQTVRHRNFFIQPGADEDDPDTHHELEGSKSVSYHALMLVAMLLPVILLSKKLAVLVEFAVADWGLPVAFGGIVIACLVLSPEAMAALNAARSNYLQRAVNVCLGSGLATIGLTVPAALAISVYLNQPLTLGLGDTEMTLLILTLFVSSLTFGGVRTNVLQGAVHLVIFLVYLVLIFSP